MTPIDSLNTASRRIEIRNARLLDPAQATDQIGNCYIEDGKIVSIGTEPLDGFTPDESCEASGKWLIPGLVDLAAYLREPGLETKATIASETYAAVKSGITTLCYSPEPKVLVNNATQVNMIHEINQRTCHANIEIIGNLTRHLDGETLSNMGGLKKAGCIGVGNGLHPIKNLQVLRMAMEYASTHDLAVFLHPQDHNLANKGCVHESAISSRLGLPGIPVAAETAALAAILMLVSETGVRTHICRISCRESVRLLEYAKQEGLPVTADVAAHQLWLTENDVADFNPLCHVMPPLRSQRDRDSLREAVANGTIDAICSDHQPHDIDAKLAPFQQTEPGISAIESFLPLTLKLVEEGHLDLLTALKSVTYNPASIIKRDYGSLLPGNQAQLVLIDPNQPWEINTQQLLSAGKNTPFNGWGGMGKVVGVWC